MGCVVNLVLFMGFARIVVLNRGSYVILFYLLFSFRCKLISNLRGFCFIRHLCGCWDTFLFLVPRFDVSLKTKML